MRNRSHRFWPCVAAVVAVAVIAVPAASAGVVKYDTKVTMFKGFRVYHGDVHSEARKCKHHRRHSTFPRRRGRSAVKGQEVRASATGGPLQATGRGGSQGRL